MTFPSTDYFRKGILQAFITPATGSQDRADWDTDTLKLYLFQDTWSSTFSGTYSTDVETGYGAGNLASGNAEATGGGAGGVGLTGTPSVTISSGKILWSLSANTQIGSGITTSFIGAFLCTSTATTKWALAAYHFGTTWSLSSANTVLIAWPTVGSTSRVLFYIG